MQAAQLIRLTTRPKPSDAPEVTSPRSAKNSPNVTALSPSPNSAPNRAALLGRATLSATSAAVRAQPITYSRCGTTWSHWESRLWPPT